MGFIDIIDIINIIDTMNIIIFNLREVDDIDLQPIGGLSSEARKIIRHFRNTRELIFDIGLRDSREQRVGIDVMKKHDGYANFIKFGPGNLQISTTIVCQDYLLRV